MVSRTTRMHAALHDAWRAFVQQHCPSPPAPLDVHHDAQAALAWLAREPASEPRDPRSRS